MLAVEMKPFYKPVEVEESILMGTVMVNDKPRDVYKVHNSFDGVKQIIVVFGNEEWEFSSYDWIDLLPDNFRGNATYEVAKNFYQLARVIG